MTELCLKTLKSKLVDMLVNAGVCWCMLREGFQMCWEAATFINFITVTGGGIGSI